jgi:sugar phosphate isomerase/epimerase
MVEIGTSTHAIAGFGKPSKAFRQALAEMAECGFAHFLLLASESGPAVGPNGDAPESLVNVLTSDLAAIRRAVASHGLRIGGIYPGGGVDFSPGKTAGTIEHLKRYRDIAWDLGCHVMAHSAGRAERPRSPHEQKKDAIRRVAEVMDALASDAPGEIFKMAVDVHYGGIIETVADCEYLLASAARRNAGLCLNMGHMTTLGQEGWTLLERFPERVHILAWKDHRLGDDLPRPVFSVELGTGKTPFPKYAAVYRRVSCRALHLITFEDVPFEEKKPALKRSREYLSRLLEG